MTIYFSYQYNPHIIHGPILKSTFVCFHTGNRIVRLEWRHKWSVSLSLERERSSEYRIVFYRIVPIPRNECAGIGDLLVPRPGEDTH